MYCNQVFVTDSVEGIVPEFLTLLHGVIDSPDIPLNVSRSYLQSDGNVKKISAHITKKVADRLEEMYRKEQESFEAKWDDIKVFIEYGFLSDEKFADKTKKFMLVKNTDNQFTLLTDYIEKIKALQTNKENKTVVLYTHNPIEHDSFIEKAKAKSYDVLVLDSPLTSHVIQKWEMDLKDVTFSRIDSDTIEKLIAKDEEIPSKLSKEEEEKVKPIIENQVDKNKFTVVFESLSETDDPIQVTQSEFMRRMMEMQKTGGGGFMGSLPEMHNLVVNSNHPLISKIISIEDDSEKSRLAKQATDLALLSVGLLKGKELTNFIKRSVDVLA